ncbi:MAG: hypothetical protein AVDCRST_MAG64-3847, partial [uncultured Phycisphaerae bacterium]
GGTDPAGRRRAGRAPPRPLPGGPARDGRAGGGRHRRGARPRPPERAGLGLRLPRRRDRRGPAPAAAGPHAQAAARAGAGADGPAGRRPAAGGRRLHAPRQGRGADPGAGVPRQVHAGRGVRAARTAGLLVPGPAPAAREGGPGRAGPVPHRSPLFVRAV